MRAASPSSLSSFHFSPECYSVRDAKASKTCSTRHLGQSSSQISGIVGKKNGLLLLELAVKHLNIVWCKRGSRQSTIYISLTILRAFACSSPQPPSSMQITRSPLFFLLPDPSALSVHLVNAQTARDDTPNCLYTFGCNLIGDGQPSLLCSDRCSFRELRVGVAGGKKESGFPSFCFFFRVQWVFFSFVQWTAGQNSL